MRKLPSEIKLTDHAKQRLLERNGDRKYNTRNLMKSSVKWYMKDDLIHNGALYKHCCYVTRKSKQMGYLTDGNIEVLYNKETKIAITVLEVKDKFKPISQHLKPQLLNQNKKERLEMEKTKICTDCGREPATPKASICIRCARRKANMKSRGKEYIPYLKLSNEEKQRLDKMINSHYKTSTPAKKEINKEELNPLPKQMDFLQVIKECGCEIPEKELQEVLNILINTDKLKDIFMIIAQNSNQQALLDLEQSLNVTERKLQHEWEYNGFKEDDDLKFKGFLTWRRNLKGAIYFWKKLYSTNALIELQRAWNAYTQDPAEKVVLVGDKDNISSMLKRYQITTETYSTILNTRRPFTRVFYAKNEKEAHDAFVKWLSDRQLHETATKTVIVELNSENSN